MVSNSKARPNDVGYTISRTLNCTAQPCYAKYTAGKSSRMVFVLINILALPLVKPRVGASLACSELDNASNATAVAELLLRRGANFQAKDTWNTSQITADAHKCNSVGLQLLLQNGTNVSEQDDGNRTAILQPASSGRYDAFDLTYKADWSANDNLNRTATHSTATSNSDTSTAVIEEPVWHINNGTEMEDDNGWSPLMIAASRGNIHAVYMLLERGAPIEAKSKYNQTALMYAAESNGRNATLVVELLLQRGANVHAKDTWNNTATHFAAKSNSETSSSVIEVLMRRTNNETEVQNVNGVTPLMGAAFNGNIQAVQTLLAHGALVEATSKYDQTALMFAAASNAKNAYRMVDLLLQRGANVHAMDVWNLTAAHYASKSNGKASSAVFEVLLWHTKNETEAKDIDGMTPLMTAASSGNMQAMQTLLAHGALIEATSKINKTAVMYAADSNARNPTLLVELLLERGANVHAKDIWNNTATHYAAQSNSEASSAVIEVLMQRTNNETEVKNINGTTPLMAAAFSGNIYGAQTLLAHGALIEATSSINQTALMFAAESSARSSPLMVELLLQRGANVHAKDLWNNTASHYAAWSSSNASSEVIKMLMRRTNNATEVKNINGTTPLMAAASQGNTHTVNLLLDYGAVMDARTKDNQTTLMYAAGSSSKNAAQVVKLLLLRGANVRARDISNRTATHYAAGSSSESTSAIIEILMWRTNNETEVKDMDGMTPLMTAAFSGNIRAVQTLLSYGARIEAADTIMRTALHAAAWSYAKPASAVAKILLQHGAYIHARNIWNETAIILATIRSRPDILKVLLEHGADANDRDGWNRTVLDYATKSGNSEVLNVLRLYAPDLFAESNERSTDGLYALIGLGVIFSILVLSVVCFLKHYMYKKRKLRVLENYALSNRCLNHESDATSYATSVCVESENTKDSCSSLDTH